MSTPRPVVTDGAPPDPPQAAALAEAIPPDLLHWLVLRAVAAGALVAASDGWREQGRRLRPYLAEPLLELTMAGCLELAEPDPEGQEQANRRLVLTDNGRIRDIRLREIFGA